MLMRHLCDLFGIGLMIACLLWFQLSLVSVVVFLSKLFWFSISGYIGQLCVVRCLPSNIVSPRIKTWEAPGALKFCILGCILNPFYHLLSYQPWAHQQLMEVVKQLSTYPISCLFFVFFLFPFSLRSIFSFYTIELEFLRKRQVAWEESFRDLYYMLRKNICGLFYGNYTQPSFFCPMELL